MAYLRGERLVRCNRGFEELLGLPAGRATGALVGDLMAGQPAVQALLRQALAGLGRHEIEFARHAPDARRAGWRSPSAAGRPVTRPTWCWCSPMSPG